MMGIYVFINYYNIFICRLKFIIYDFIILNRILVYKLNLNRFAVFDYHNYVNTFENNYLCFITIFFINLTLM